MDIDMAVLRSLEREKEISFDILVEAIEQALLTAYHKTPGAQEQARVELDRKTGHVTVMAAETDDEGNVLAEYDDALVLEHPRLGRLALTHQTDDLFSLPGRTVSRVVFRRDPDGTVIGLDVEAYAWGANAAFERMR